jgi:hypothetical protein
MKLILAAAGLCVLAAAASLPKVDLDGDGRPEKIVRTEEMLLLAGGEVNCGGFDFPCDVTEMDVRTSDTFKELLICQHGPRDDLSCELWTVRNGSPVRIKIQRDDSTVLYPGAVSSTGGGILLVDEDERFWTRRHKLILSSDGVALTYVDQASFNVDAPVHVDRTFAITTEPGGGTRVANVRPDSDIQVLLEHGSTRGTLLIRVSSGLIGWTTIDVLMQASDSLMGILMAG